MWIEPLAFHEEDIQARQAAVGGSHKNNSVGKGLRLINTFPIFNLYDTQSKYFAFQLMDF